MLLWGSARECGQVGGVYVVIKVLHNWPLVYPQVLSVNLEYVVQVHVWLDLTQCCVVVVH